MRAGGPVFIFLPSLMMVNIFGSLIPSPLILPSPKGTPRLSIVWMVQMNLDTITESCSALLLIFFCGLPHWPELYPRVFSSLPVVELPSESCGSHINWVEPVISLLNNGWLLRRACIGVCLSSISKTVTIYLTISAGRGVTGVHLKVIAVWAFLHPVFLRYMASLKWAIVW